MIRAISAYPLTEEIHGIFTEESGLSITGTSSQHTQLSWAESTEVTV